MTVPATVRELADRIESEGPSRELMEAAWCALYPEPETGPWYWRTRAWSDWNFYLWRFEKAVSLGRWDIVLEWLYRGDVPEMIHSDPAKAIAACLRAHAQDQDNAD